MSFMNGHTSKLQWVLPDVKKEKMQNIFCSYSNMWVQWWIGRTKATLFASNDAPILTQESGDNSENPLQ